MMQCCKGYISWHDGYRPVRAQLIQDNQSRRQPVCCQQRIQCYQTNPFFSSILLNQIQQQQRDESDEEEINQEENPFLNLINNTLSEVIEERQLEEAIQRSMEEI